MNMERALFGFFLLASFTFSSLAKADGNMLQLENKSSYWIAYVFITPAGTDNWGDDQLGSEALLPGNSKTWNIPWNGCYIDVKAQSMLGYTAVRKNLDVCGGITWTLYDGKE